MTLIPYTKSSRNLSGFVLSCTILLVLSPSVIFASASTDLQQQEPSSENRKYFSNLHRNVLTETGYKEDGLGSTIGNENAIIKNVTIVDYAEPAPKSRLKGSFSITATDPCGDGSNQFTTNNGGVRWRNFPVTYAIDTTNSGVDATAARNAVINAFEEFDIYMPGEALILTNDFSSATIKFRWAPIDGPLGVVGITEYSYNPSTLTLTSATITMDSGENWFVSSVQSCGSAGNQLDLENVAAHEIGHGVGLGHVSDDLLTMYPTSFAGETLKRSLGNGDRVGINFLYPGWSQWDSLGGGLRDNSNPEVIANSDGRLEAFGVGSNNALFHKWQTAPGSSTWSQWSSLGGGIKAGSSAAVAINSDGRLEVFIVGTNNQLFHKWQTAPGSSTWSQWSSLGGGIKENTSPAVTINSDGRLGVFIIGTDNSLYTKSQTSAGSSTWTQWQSLGGALRANTDPTVIANSNGRLQVFVVGTDNSLYTKSQTSAGSNTWSQWSSLGGGIKPNTSPAAAINSDGRLEVFIIGTDNAIHHRWQMSAGSSTWSAYESLGGGLRDNSDPEVIINSDGRLEVFVVGSNNALFHIWQSSPGSSTWSAYETLGGAVKASTSSAAERNSDGRLEVFIVGTGSALFHKWQITT